MLSHLLLFVLTQKAPLGSQCQLGCKTVAVLLYGWGSASILVQAATVLAESVQSQWRYVAIGAYVYAQGGPGTNTYMRIDQQTRTSANMDQQTLSTETPGACVFVCISRAMCVCLAVCLCLYS